MLRLAIFLLVLAFLVPDGFLPGPLAVASKGEAREDVAIGDMMGMVQRVGADLTDLCRREPQACQTGARLGGQIRDRALAWTESLQGWLRTLDTGDTMPVAASAVSPDFVGEMPEDFDPYADFDARQRRLQGGV